MKITLISIGLVFVTVFLVGLPVTAATGNPHWFRMLLFGSSYITAISAIVFGALYYMKRHFDKE